MSKEELEKLSKISTGVSIEEALEVIALLDDLSKLLDEDELYVSRVVGLKRLTTKKDPLDCAYVKKALAYTLGDQGRWIKLKQLLVELGGRIR